MDHKTDIAVVGAGLSGLALSCILAAQGINVICIDRMDPKNILNSNFDGRTTAISLGSKHVLQRAGIWKKIEVHGCAIEDIHIMDNSSPILLEFLAEDAKEDAFGWIFENLTLRKALYERATELECLFLHAPQNIESFTRHDDHICIQTDDDETAIKATLLIGADGRRSAVREWANIKTRHWDYNQSALICTVTHENPHNHIAIEDFRNEGPFAVLPMRDDDKGHHRSSLVWSYHGKNPDDNPASWPDDVFNVALNARFPDFYGEVSANTKRQTYPLGLIHAHNYTVQRTALIADAAHAIHPIAGQGLNLGYRDVDVLCDLLIEAHKNKNDFGDKDLLKTYEQKRRLDITAMTATTDLLTRLFSNDSKLVGMARKIGLQGIQKFKPARTFFMNQAMGKSAIKSKSSS